VKKPLTNAVIYFGIAGAVYLLILAAPDQIGFYGLLFFYLIHFPGVILIALFSRHNVGQEPHYMHYVIGLVLITVNAALVFWISWIARMKEKPDKQ
jgi:hypothetical protein